MQTSNSYVGKKAVIIGGGVIGASWAALFLVHGLNVVVSDPDPEISSKVKSIVGGALPALGALGYDTTIEPEMLSFEEDNSRAVENAAIVQECGPEKVEFKQKLWKSLEGAAPKTDADNTASALAFYTAMGKVAREIEKEISGFVANRLQAAIFRDSVFLVSEGVVTLEELDDQRHFWRSNSSHPTAYLLSTHCRRRATLGKSPSCNSMSKIANDV